MNYQKTVIAGNATDDARQLMSKDGKVPYTTFSVGVSDARGQTTYFPVTVFGRQGEAVAEYVRKGRQVLVEGRINVRDDGRFNMVADRVEFGPAPAAVKEEA
jgi:single-strand DNA-binding protein